MDQSVFVRARALVEPGAQIGADCYSCEHVAIEKDVAIDRRAYGRTYRWDGQTLALQQDRIYVAE